MATDISLNEFSMFESTIPVLANTFSNISPSTEFPLPGLTSIHTTQPTTSLEHLVTSPSQPTATLVSNNDIKISDQVASLPTSSGASVNSPNEASIHPLPINSPSTDISGDGNSTGVPKPSNNIFYSLENSHLPTPTSRSTRTQDHQESLSIIKTHKATVIVLVVVCTAIVLINLVFLFITFRNRKHHKRRQVKHQSQLESGDRNNPDAFGISKICRLRDQNPQYPKKTRLNSKVDLNTSLTSHPINGNSKSLSDNFSNTPSPRPTIVVAGDDEGEDLDKIMKVKASDAPEHCYFIPCRRSTNLSNFSANDLLPDTSEMDKMISSGSDSLESTDNTLKSKRRGFLAKNTPVHLAVDKMVKFRRSNLKIENTPHITDPGPTSLRSQTTQQTKFADNPAMLMPKTEHNDSLAANQSRRGSQCSERVAAVAANDAASLKSFDENQNVYQKLLQKLTDYTIMDSVNQRFSQGESGGVVSPRRTSKNDESELGEKNATIAPTLNQQHPLSFSSDQDTQTGDFVHNWLINHSICLNQTLPLRGSVSSINSVNFPITSLNEKFHSMEETRMDEYPPLKSVFESSTEEEDDDDNDQRDSFEKFEATLDFNDGLTSNSIITDHKLYRNNLDERLNSLIESLRPKLPSLVHDTHEIPSSTKSTFTKAQETTQMNKLPFSRYDNDDTLPFNNVHRTINSSESSRPSSLSQIHSNFNKHDTTPNSFHHSPHLLYRIHRRHSTNASTATIFRQHPGTEIPIPHVHRAPSILLDNEITPNN